MARLEGRRPFGRPTPVRERVMAYDHGGGLDRRQIVKYMRWAGPAGAWTVAARHARKRAEWPYEESSDAFLRRREKYAAAVALSVAISAALTGTVWGGGLIGDAEHGEA